MHHYHTSTGTCTLKPWQTLEKLSENFQNLSWNHDNHTTVWIIRWNRYDSFLYNKSWEIGRKITLPSVCELCVSTVIHHNVLHATINIGILITSYLINMRIHLSTYQYESGLGFCIIRSHNLVHHISIFFNFFFNNWKNDLKARQLQKDCSLIKDTK